MHSFGFGSASATSAPAPAADGFGGDAMGTAMGTSSGTTSGATSTMALKSGRSQARKLGTPQLIMLALGPWLVFVVYALLFTFPYHSLPRLIWGLVIVGTAVCCWCVYSGLETVATNPSRTFTGALSLFSIFQATLLGLIVYNWFMVHYHNSHERDSYTSVSPTEEAAAYASAGKIVFVDEARVDSTKSLGFMDTYVYCVAPILGDTNDIGSIQFWAAGRDCCGPRGNFVCDDAWNPKARSGVVIRDVSDFFEDSHGQYMKAIKQAEAAYELSSAENPLLVRWVVDPDQLEFDYFGVSVGIIIVLCALWLLVASIETYIVYTLWKSQ